MGDSQSSLASSIDLYQPVSNLFHGNFRQNWFYSIFISTREQDKKVHWTAVKLSTRVGTGVRCESWYNSDWQACDVVTGDRGDQEVSLSSNERLCQAARSQSWLTVIGPNNDTSVQHISVFPSLVSKYHKQPFTVQPRYHRNTDAQVAEPFIYWPQLQRDILLLLLLQR